MSSVITVEEREVDGVHAFAQDRPLPAALAGDGSCSGLTCSPHQEAAGVLEVVARDHLAQRLAGRQGLAVAGIDVADLALRHRHQRDAVDPVLPPPEAEMQTAAQDLGLETRPRRRGR